MTYGELLIVRRDPERVATRTRKRGAIRRQVSEKPWAHDRHERECAHEARGPAGSVPWRGPRCPTAADEPCGRRRDGQEQSIHAGQARATSQDTTSHDPRTRAISLQSPARHIQRQSSQNAKNPEIVDRWVIDEQWPAKSRQNGSHASSEPAAPEPICDDVREGDQRGAQHDHRGLACPPAGPDHRYRSSSEDRYQRHPVPVAGHRQDGDIRDAAAHL